MVSIAVGQMCSSSNLKENAAKAIKLIVKASRLNCKVLFLPEASDYIAKNANHSKSIARSVTESPFILEIQQKLKELNEQGKSLCVSVGIHEPSDTSDRVRNTLVWLNEEGVIEQRYQKIHLFDVDISNGPILKESLSVEPGNSILPPFQSKAGKIGFGICYDIRFPELALRLRSMGAEILTYPSAFTVKTGKAHWHLLGRARAIDTQCFVVMAAQSGEHKTQTEDELKNGEPIVKRESYGHSLIIDPWGTILAECEDGDDLCTADIDLSVMETIRRDMPLWSQRRPDVFGHSV